MLLTHNGCSPRVDPSATVAPTAVVCGDVEIGPDSHVGFGAVLIAEGSSIRIGRQLRDSVDTHA
jgi:carbonic anhydrase/acetyltransferase-like protein (isoleucine patch superfamily)